MRAVLALVIVLAGVLAGVAAGVLLGGSREVPPPETAPPAAEGPSPGHSYVKLGRQFVIPVVEGGVTRALMLFELAIDVPAPAAERVYAAEPRLRDAFLRELFELSHTGGFMGTYTDERILGELRENLSAAARLHLGDDVNEVLILDVMRQEL